MGGNRYDCTDGESLSIDHVSLHLLLLMEMIY